MTETPSTPSNDSHDDETQLPPPSASDYAGSTPEPAHVAPAVSATDQTPDAASGVTPGVTAYGAAAFSQASTPSGSPTSPAASAPNAYAPSAATSTATATDAPTAKKRNVVPLVAALAVGALIGGVSGAGVATLATNNSSDTSNNVASPQTITVNDTQSVSSVTAVAAKASPSVVTISVATNSAGGTGSGIILSDDGYILTNTHVVTLDGASNDGTIEVTTYDGKLYKAKVVGIDPIVDLAVIKLVDASGLTPMAFADSSDLNVGDQAVAIGAPLGLSNTVTDGIVSALNRSIQIASSAVPEDTSSQDSNGDDNSGSNDGQGPFDFWNFGQDPGTGTGSPQSSTISLPVVQTDAAINPGNSGGALVNSEGKLIGVNVAIASTGGSSASSQSGSIGVGFAIPANVAKRVADEIIATGSASHGLLGASVRDASSDDSSTVGALIAESTSGGAAADAGIAAGDVITSFDGIPITGSTDLTAQVRSLAGGDKAKVTYTRDGKSTTVEVTLGTLS